ncbi:hypothetical protein BDQ94DRAFT_154209 [Aspergillus welwitschiae]|uniref:Uncharacterized protein n=1 Tax=Aspergillus welwitschiae TaxID=1341132 RepID=A0A3F3PK40_9EURO|nr:hypothetical protein BDQ94DRAFT_154209 [Aspergillus welwitschiae]RDH27301.1 hypothetical protein BDQ94DRAFT_154209 [Aspergillus welwitschiae]
MRSGRPEPAVMINRGYCVLRRAYHTVIEGLPVGGTERVVAVVCLGGYCSIEGQAVVLVAMELPNSAL